MQSENRFFDDFARMASGAFGALGALKTELEGQMRQHMESMLARMKLVTREEFEAVQAMAAKARDEQEALAARVAALEGRRPTRPAAATGTAGPIQAGPIPPRRRPRRPPGVPPIKPPK